MKNGETKPSQRVTILGSTGSVGSNTIDLIERNPDRYQVEALTAHRNVELLAEQAVKVKAKAAIVADASCYSSLKDRLEGTGIEVGAGEQAILAAVDRPADFVMASMVGAAGLLPTVAAIRKGRIVGLANKETLVSAGQIVMAEVATSGSVLLPVDSEHSAIFQLFDFEHQRSVESIVLTASGGPFRTFALAEMADVSPDEAVAHPNWRMGAKISVDSATMMNKGLELIEAYHLFPVGLDQIDIVVHPQSIIHGMVSFIDGSVFAHLGFPDMRVPIGYALAYPERLDLPETRFRFSTLKELTFEQPDPQRFPAIRLAREALATGGSATTVLNAANEVAVATFLRGGIGFLDIARVVEETLDRCQAKAPTAIDEVLAIDLEARSVAERVIASRPN